MYISSLYCIGNREKEKQVHSHLRLNTSDDKGYRINGALQHLSKRLHIQKGQITANNITHHGVLHSRQ